MMLNFYIRNDEGSEVYSHSQGYKYSDIEWLAKIIRSALEAYTPEEIESNGVQNKSE